MARKNSSKNNGGIASSAVLIILVFAVISVIYKFISNNIGTILIIALIVAAVGIAVFLINRARINRQEQLEDRLRIERIEHEELVRTERKQLLDNMLNACNLKTSDIKVPDYDDCVVVKSRQALSNYTDIKYIKDNDALDRIKTTLDKRNQVIKLLSSFPKNNEFSNDRHYYYVESQFADYLRRAGAYIVEVRYVTPAGNNMDKKTLSINSMRVDELISHPESLMAATEYNKYVKQQSQIALDEKKHSLYDHVNTIISYANASKEKMIVESYSKSIDSYVQSLFDRTVNSIQKITKLDSDEWDMIEDFIADIEYRIHSTVKSDLRIANYYTSDEFAKLKNACLMLTQSQRDFNEYIDEKAKSIAKLFGTRVTRNETQNEDANNYIRAYKKSITPFTAEVSSAVFGSAENNPIGYIVKYFYPNKNSYNEQIQKLRTLIEELETLHDAKKIIDNYKKDYSQYIKDVPKYVLENDESGFYSRLGFAVIDESVLNVEYKFVYTSDGGMAQRSFTVPMNEENITALIEQLESKLSLTALVKEQRALMTSKLREFIKTRDNYTCCQCGNSTHIEPNLLLEIDHIIPVSKGGLTKEDNLQTLCWKCNRAKSAKLIV